MILAVDHGLARIGIAISDASGIVARPIEVIQHQAYQTDAERVAAIAATHRVGLIVVGLPTDGEGRMGQAARTVRRFGDALSEISELPVKYWDESYSTKRAKEIIRETRRSARPQLDAVAAAVILQDYLDTHAAHTD